MFDPLMNRVAEKVMEDMLYHNELHWFLLSIVLWNSLLTVVIFYRFLKSFQCRRQNIWQMEHLSCI